MTQEALTQEALTHEALQSSPNSASSDPRWQAVRDFFAVKPITTAAFAVGVLLLAGFVVEMFNEPFRLFVLSYASQFVVAVALVLMLVLGTGVKRLSVGAHIAERTRLLIFVALPLVLVVVTVAMLTVQDDWQLMPFRVIFLSVVIFLPAIMWWLFIAAQKASLLNEFLTNLDRFGLLEADATTPAPTSEVLADARSARIRSYLKKFEASFGDLPDDVYEDVLKGRFGGHGRDDVEPSALSSATVPVALATAIVAVGWLLILPPFGVDPPPGVLPVWLHTLEPAVTPVTLAFLGAYFFSIQMLFRRYVRRDLRGCAYVTMVMRIILAMIGIWVLTAIGPAIGIDSEWLLLMVGFVVGVFPQVLWQLVRNAFSSRLAATLPTMQSELALDKLDGLTVWHEARLEEEDIENVPNMATADIVELLVSTRFPAERIVSWVDQAILLTQLGTANGASGRKGADVVAMPAADLLARHGIRTASQLIAVTEDADALPGGWDALLATMQDPQVIPNLRALLSAIRNNENLLLILTWHYSRSRVAQTGS